MITIRSIVPNDIPEVLKVQRLCYKPALNEAAPAFLRKLTLFDKGCLGAWDRNCLCGYVFSHPWRSGEVVPLDTDSYALPTNADCLYIHDLAVEPAYQNHRVGHALLEDLFEMANRNGWCTFALVAVQHSERFWERWGFGPRHKFEYTSGINATYMIRKGRPQWK